MSKSNPLLPLSTVVSETLYEELWLLDIITEERGGIAPFLDNLCLELDILTDAAPDLVPRLLLVLWLHIATKQEIENPMDCYQWSMRITGQRFFAICLFTIRAQIRRGGATTPLEFLLNEIQQRADLDPACLLLKEWLTDYARAKNLLPLESVYEQNIYEEDNDEKKEEPIHV